ncbi:MAG TPA: phosphoribosyl-ATP diphosphatase [Alphaproteobacteria bacterium]|nr:phosphoribosyl-ATP diphosphatase [Alphaproteobacteria bacterium]
MAETFKLGEVIEQLAKTIAARKTASPDSSYTASLLAGGPAKCAKKFGEEATELVIAAATETAEQVASEAGDVIYHLLVLLAARNVDVSAVAAALAARAGQSGHAEKASRK